MMIDDIYARNVPGSFSILRDRAIGIAGAGGLGSNVALMLARAGVGKLVVADHDIVEANNLNRQMFFLDQIGKPKVDALSETLFRINPEIKYEGRQITLTSDNLEAIFNGVDVLVEAFDDAREKSMLIEKWCLLENGVPLVAASGLSGYGKIDKIKTHKTGNLIIVGDFESSMSEGLMAPKVMLVASMQACAVLEILLEKSR